MKKAFFALTAAAMLAGAPALAQDNFANQAKARQGQMWTIAINLGILGGMARGNADYDAAAAQAAADSILAVSGIHQAPFWPEGSDNMSMDGSRALPAIWDNMAGFEAEFAKKTAAATALAAAAGNGLEGLGPLVGALGGTCQSCHEAYREPN